MPSKPQIATSSMEMNARNLKASGASLPARAVPPPGQQVADLQERLLEEAGLTREKRIELAKRLIESLERGLEAHDWWDRGTRAAT